MAERTETVPRYLLRIWGRDEAQIAAIRSPDARERDDGPLCYWFIDEADREAFLLAFPDQACVVRDKVDAGRDWDGEILDPNALTIADVVLRLPDGREGRFTMRFGYGYPAHSAVRMWREGNYACDCNKRLFSKRST